ncbi:hypothetical protein TTHERM_000732799 (macronuclear) [Tetrahymena thermophila SB210]|uniref:Uncharacterized protein n=1 Tax=Tetrahymena thermophila (strain SB210) TaxID=312017 RepID=W7XDZ5_TETTS|nr:hypothetical protein TTHERM_000732799 [Tetrahymena thermophila SB210]EWS72141.1 hypothetical protein TTHERM_000732799 [Tetrahymena thermophila SB210]|eukprot:XP_012655334.1 hypothetical protein TTHERM_000732799 [Tetrahymena thermophila SB210]
MFRFFRKIESNSKMCLILAYQSPQLAFEFSPLILFDKEKYCFILFLIGTSLTLIEVPKFNKSQEF